MERIRVSYSDAFRRKVAADWMRSEEPITEVAKRYGIATELVSLWGHRYEEEYVTDEDYQGLKRRIGELERMVDRLAKENAFLKKFAASKPTPKSRDTLIVTAKNLAQSRRAVKSWGLPAAATTTERDSGKEALNPTLGSKGDLKPLPPFIPDTDTGG